MAQMASALAAQARQSLKIIDSGISKLSGTLFALYEVG